jgi:uncharacterized protein with PIN domain
MDQVYITLNNELNDFLPPRKRGELLTCRIKSQPSVKHIVESAGIPHTEIGELNLDGNTIDFNYLVHPGDRIFAYPFSPEHDVISGLFNHGKLTIRPYFVLDNHLGKLATYLRILGFDSLYDKDYQDVLLAEIASGSERILITRDRQLLMRKSIRWGYWVRSKHPETQTIEIIHRFRMKGLIAPFHRCLNCNSLLQPVPKEEILHRLQPLTKRYFDEFQFCPGCDRIYWKGSHYERMLKLVSRVTSGAETIIQ